MTATTTTTPASIESAVEQELLSLEAAESIFEILALDPSNTPAAADILAGFLDKAGESLFAARVREARADGDRLCVILRDFEHAYEKRLAPADEVAALFRGACDAANVVEAAHATARVLVVDDDSSIARAFERLLSARGFSAIKASSVAEARGLLEHSLDPEVALPFDAVLSDVDMPGGSGFDLVAWMSEREYPSKAVLMSADSYSPERRERAGALGVKLLDKAREQDEILAEVAEIAAIKVCW